MAKSKKKYHQGSGNSSWFGVSEGSNGLPPSEVIVRSMSPYEGNDLRYEAGMEYQEKQMMETERGIKKQKLDRHF